MEKLLIIMGGMRFAGRGPLRGEIDQEPDLGFHYDSLHYEPTKGIAFKLYRSEQINLLDHEIRLIKAYIDAFRFRVWLLGEDGLPYTQVYEDEATTPYAHCLPPALPEHYWYNPASGQWDIIYGVDTDGKYLGNVPLIECAFIANCRPSFDYERWDAMDSKWFDARSLPEMKKAAKISMRNIANRARSSGVIFGGLVYGSTVEEFESYEDAALKSIVTEYWNACESRYMSACAEIDAATSAEAIGGVLF